MVTSSGPTRSVERMIVRARSVRPYQCRPDRSRGTASPILTGSSRPASLARQRLAASTVIRTSAGVFVALGLEPLVQLGGVAAAERQVGARLLGEVLERLLLAVVRAGGVEHELVGRRARRWPGPRRRRRPRSSTVPPMTSAEQPAARHPGVVVVPVVSGVVSPVVSVPVPGAVGARAGGLRARVALELDVPQRSSPQAATPISAGSERRRDHNRGRLPQHAH